MKSGNTVKLVIQQDQSDISSQYQQKTAHNYFSTNQSQPPFKDHHYGAVQEEYEDDEDNIDMLIRQSQVQNKINRNGGLMNKSCKIEGKDKSETSFSITQTKTIPLKQQNKKKTGNQEQFNLNKYQFKMESSKQAIKNLRVSEIHGHPQISQKRGKIIQPSLTKTQTEINIQNIPVYFPYQPYEIQKQYMSAVIRALNDQSNALLESPTGTGKTLCLLSSVLSWADNYNRQNLQKVTVIYCSRTHTQLRQVQSELQKTCFRPTMSNFGSRDQFCIKKQFSAIKGRDLMESCSKAVKLYLKSKRKLELDEQDSVMVRKQLQAKGQNSKQQAHLCYYYKSQSEYLRILQSFYQNKIVTSQMIKAEGQLHHFCPYYYAFQVKQRADLIFMPYNYILDVDRIPKYESIIKNSVIILDEAHNVPEAACEGRTFEIYSNIFNNIQTQLKKLEYNSYMSPELKQVAYSFESTRHLLQKQCKYLRNKMDLLAENVHNRRHPNNDLFNYEDKIDIEQIFKPQELKIMIYSWFGPEQYDTKQYEKLDRGRQKLIFMKTVEHLNKIIKQTNQLIEALKQTYDGIFQNLQKLNTFIEKCRDLISEFESDTATDWWNKQVNHYRLCVKCIVKQGVFLYQIKLVCLTPSLTFNDLAKYKPRSILLTSGTLSPLDSWQKQLNFPFAIKLMNKHVIEKQQLHLGIICKSKNNESTFNFSYNQLQNNPMIYKNLLKTIVHICSKVNNGVLVIFPSYKIISTFKDLLSKDASSLAELQKVKNICFEDRGTVDHIILNFKNKARTSKGAALFCVCRGKVSEGLDFSDELCRAVIFIGVPYPNIKDPILKQKRDYYDRLSTTSKNKGVLSLTGDEWYTLTTMRAVNQGIGRVIRHINDYGLILMLDNRYDQPKLRKMLPYWARENMSTYNNFGQIDAKIDRFYTEMKQKFPTKYGENSQAEQQNAYLKKPRAKDQDKKLSKQVKKDQKQPQKPPQKSYFQIMMSNANKAAERKKSKKKQLDFL